MLITNPAVMICLILAEAVCPPVPKQRNRPACAHTLAPVERKKGSIFFLGQVYLWPCRSNYSVSYQSHLLAAGFWVFFFRFFHWRCHNSADLGILQSRCHGTQTQAHVVRQWCFCQQKACQSESRWVFTNTRTFGVRGDHVVDYQSRWEISPDNPPPCPRLFVHLHSCRHRGSMNPWHSPVPGNCPGDILAKYNSSKVTNHQPSPVFTCPPCNPFNLGREFPNKTTQ